MTPTAFHSAAALELELAVPSDLGPWIEDRLHRWAASSRTAGATLLLTVPAPETDPEALLEIFPPAVRESAMSFFWHPPAGPAVAGVGATRLLQITPPAPHGAKQIFPPAPQGAQQLSGGRRFAELRRQAERLWEGLEVIRHPLCDPGSERSPRLYGGLAFDVGAAAAEPWTEFGGGCFTLPRLAYERGGTSSLTLAVERDEICFRGAAELASELESALADLDRWRTRPVASPMLVDIERPDRSRFAAEIGAIRRAIAGGEVEKIVAAGRSRARFTSPLSTAAVLRRLQPGLLASTRFAFCREHSAFLGATPERLIKKRGRAIATEALAGSIASGTDYRELLASGKDRREQQLVVDAIVRRLEPICDRLEVAPRPRIRELREVLHLHTPISGVLSASRHVLELVEELHPTPAVGGVPADAARDWIRDHERHPRGWYAAPIGWFDAAGDGEFDVALRSALLSGGEAFVYAGAGIVRDSEPDLEYTETELKKQALLTALGA